MHEHEFAPMPLAPCSCLVKAFPLLYPVSPPEARRRLKAKRSSRGGWCNTNSVPINSIVFTFHHVDALRPDAGLPVCVQRVARTRWPKEPNAPSQGRIGRVARRGVTGPGDPMAFDHPAQRRHCCDPITNVVALGCCQICIAARHLAPCVWQLCLLED